MDYKQKYLKYKKKYIELKGGFLSPHQDFSNIKSLGFEFETGMLCPFTGEISGNLLKLTPFGFNEYSKDETHNRSLVRLQLNDVKVSDRMIGKFEYTQDSYDLFDITPVFAMDTSEELSRALHGKKDLFPVIESTGNIKNIQFDVNIDEGKTVGHSEFLCTFLQLDENILNITDCSLVVTNQILNLFSNNNIKLIGHIDIPYKEYSRENPNDLRSKVSITDSIFKTSIFKLTYISDLVKKDVYIFTQSNPQFQYKTKDIFNDIIMAPQITVGIDNMNFSRTIFMIGDEYRYKTDKNFLITTCMSIGEDIKYLVDHILNNTSITEEEKRHLEDKTNYDLLYNYLMLFFTYTDVDNFEIYEFNESTDEIELKKYGVTFIPRQHYYEIIDKHQNLKESIRILYTYGIEKIIYRRIYKLSGILYKPILEHDNVMSNITIENIPKIFGETSHQLKNQIYKILNNEKKMFDVKYIGISKLKKVDPISSYTTKIPYNGKTFIVEYRLLMSKLDNERKKLYYIDTFNNNTDFINILKNYKIGVLMENTTKEKKDSVNEIHKKFISNVHDMYQEKLNTEIKILTE